MKQIAIPLLVLLAAIFTTPLLGQAPLPVKDPGYRIGPRDLLEIRVFETPELNVSRRVSEDGEINLPLLGVVQVAGLTETEAAQKIKEVLEAKALQHASVAVQVQEFRSRPITVTGAVRQPGNLAFSGRWTLLEALTAAGGLAEGHGNIVYVLRRAANGLSDQVAISADDLMVRADPKANVPIFSGDLINVPGTVSVTIYCLGEIHQPGALSFVSSERISLLAAIARAGGLTEHAARKILIKRKGPTGEIELTADYKRIVGGKDPDVELQAGDIVVVKESFF